MNRERRTEKRMQWINDVKLFVEIIWFLLFVIWFQDFFDYLPCILDLLGLISIIIKFFWFCQQNKYNWMDKECTIRITFRIKRIAVLCWFVSWTQRGSSSSSVSMKFHPCISDSRKDKEKKWNSLMNCKFANEFSEVFCIFLVQRL